MSLLLHYTSLAEFKKLYYAPLLTHEHLEEGQVAIEKVKLPDGGEDDNFNFWGYRLKKDGVKYLLPAQDSKKKEIVLRDTLPIMVERSSKVSYRGEVYQVIKKYRSARFVPERTMSFKELVDRLTPFQHSHPQHYKLLYFVVLSQLYYRSNFRVCSPPSFGKDSAVDTLRDLIGGASTIVQPTRAKLEYRATVYNLLAINEVSDIGNTEWENIQSFLLDAGAYKTSIEKQTRGFGIVGEVLDISKFSLLLLYNDIVYVAEKNKDKYIDIRAHKALLDRFPPLRLHGRFREDFNKIATTDVHSLVSASIPEYQAVIRSFLYYKGAGVSHRYSRDKLLKKYGRREISERWKHSLHNLLNIIDLYSDNQEEFDEWVGVVNRAITDYYDMMDMYNDKERLVKKLGEDKYYRLLDSVSNKPTYTERKVVFDEETAPKSSGFDWDKMRY